MLRFIEEHRLAGHSPDCSICAAYERAESTEPARPADTALMHGLLRDIGEWAKQVEHFPIEGDEAYRSVSATDLRILRDFAEQALAAQPTSSEQDRD